MIDAVEVMHEEEQQAMYVSYCWERISDSLSHLLCEVDDEQKEAVRESNGDKNQPEFDKLRTMLERVDTYIEGQIAALNPDLYKHRREFYHYAGREEREVLQYALQEGINAVALEKLPRKKRRDAIEYIMERGLASMNYESACKAVIEYCIEDNARKYGVRLSTEEAARIWA